MREPLKLHSDSAAATRAFGAKLGHALSVASGQSSVLIALNGDLGAGKTTFVSGLLEALGHRGAVKSPTYTLMETYELAGREFHHLDLYRLNDASELESLGFHDLLQPRTIVLIEWAERAAIVRAVADLSIDIKYVLGGERARSFELIYRSELGQELMRTAFSSE